MKTFKFTCVQKQYYDQEIQANSSQEASEIFNDMICNDEISWDNPTYLDSDQFFEEIENA